MKNEPKANSYDEQIGRRIRSLLNFYGIDIAELASKVNVTYKTMHRYLVGERAIPHETLASICIYLKCPIDLVYFGDLEVLYRYLSDENINVAAFLSIYLDNISDEKRKKEVAQKLMEMLIHKFV